MTLFSICAHCHFLLLHRITLFVPVGPFPFTISVPWFLQHLRLQFSVFSTVVVGSLSLGDIFLLDDLHVVFCASLELSAFVSCCAYLGSSFTHHL